MSVCYLLYQENISMLFTHEKKKQKTQACGSTQLTGPCDMFTAALLVNSPQVRGLRFQF